MKIKVELSGGLELLFNKNKTLDFKIDDPKDNFSIRDLIELISESIKEKQEFFITKDKQIRPGIIVLINDSDWEIFEKENTLISDGDSVSFISTLHGG